MKQNFNEKRTAVLSCVVILLLVFADFSSRTAVKSVMASRTHVPVLCVETDKNELALTYDVSLTSDVAEILNALGDTKATFFVDGEVVGLMPEKVKLIADSGHEIGIVRDDYKGNSQKEINDKTAGMLEETSGITGKNINLVRFGKNSYDSNAVRAIFSLGLFPVQWSTDGTVGYYSPGDIVLITDDTDIQELIKKIKADGLEAVTVGEMLIKDNYKIDICGRMIK